MVDRSFSDPALASLYDTIHPHSPGDAFYLPLLMSSTTVLDIGCGTGTLLHRARDAGHTGRLCGLDPADAMLNQARKRPDIEWILGDLTLVNWDQEFDLAVMTGHAFQVLTHDEQLHHALSTIRTALNPGGRFAFETRNPHTRPWRNWTPDNATSTTAANGDPVRVERHVETPVEGELVTFTETFTSPAWAAPKTSRTTLRFLSPDTLASLLRTAGLTIEEQYGDWNQSPLTDTSPEIITIARRS
jgi:ubiquinone/menaquinone biosynthesis C-methylase UbiE